MSWVERLEQFATAFWAALGGSVAGGFWWLIRRILTNQQEINALKSELKSSREIRAENDRHTMAALTNLHTDVREMRADIKLIHRNNPEK